MQTLGPAHTVPGFGFDQPAAMTVDCGEPFVITTNDRFVGMPSGHQPDRNKVTALVGPVHIKDVEPGDILAIEIRRIVPHADTAYLLSSAAFGILGERVEQRARAVSLDAVSIQLTDDVTVAFEPMIGKLGVASATPQSSNTSGAFGGALSATQIAPGHTLLVEVFKPGAQLCIEDVHARMGDGEATSSAVEMAADVELCCTIHARGGKPVGLPVPVLLNKTEAICFGQGDTLDTAAAAATETMVQWLMHARNVDMTEAALLTGAVADIRISYFGTRPCQVRASIDRRLVCI